MNESQDILDKYNKWHIGIAENEEENVLNLPWYKTVLSLLPDLNNKTIVEVGCGRGVFANHLATAFPNARITGIDFATSAIEIAQKRYSGKPNLNFEVGNAEQLRFSDNTFDYYISCETIEHVYHPDAMIRELKRILKPKGEFILTTENYLNAYLMIWAQCWITKKPFPSGSGIQPHENFFIFPFLLNWFRKAGVRITHTQSNHFQWLLLPRIAPAKLCTENFKTPFFNRLFKPFGRHYTYQGVKP